MTKISTKSDAKSIFNWIWLLLSVLVSFYLSFGVYPKLLLKHNSTLTPLYFQVKDMNGGYHYLVNNEVNRESPLYKNNLSDNKQLYYNVCNLVIPNLRDSCRDDINWWAVDVKTQFGNFDVKSCFKESVRIPDELREQRVISTFTNKGRVAGIEGREKASLSDPGGWGGEAKWPLFFFFLYLRLEIGTNGQGICLSLCSNRRFAYPSLRTSKIFLYAASNKPKGAYIRS